MAFNLLQTKAFLGTSLHVLLAAAAFVVSAQLIHAYGQYASSVVLAAVGVFFLADAYRLARRHVRISTQAERSSSFENDQKIHMLEALIDAVAVGLFVLKSDGRISYINRAGRSLVGSQVASLSDFRGAGTDAIAVLSSLPSGGRQVVNFEDGRTMLLWAGAFTVPGSSPRRLLSVQSISGELDAAQIGAWQAMTRVLAHEIMNSLTPIVSLAQNVAPLAQGGGVRSDIVSAIDTIARRSAYLMDFVERYREIAELPAVQTKEIDVSVMFGDIERLILSQTAVKKSALSFETTGDLFLHADPDLLERALRNLVRNAIEAVDNKDGGKINLSAWKAEDRTIFQVEDNGPGVPEELLSEIFVPFFTTKAEGSGIGLFLAKQVASVHRGTLTAKRGQSGGMIFQLAIPDCSQTLAE